MTKEEQPVSRKRKRATTTTAAELNAKYPQPGPEDVVNNQRACYVHSADIDYEQGYILSCWFIPTKEQIKALGRARVAHTGYYVRAGDGQLQRAMKCIIEQCPLCELAVHEGVNPIEQT